MFLSDYLRMETELMSCHQMSKTIKTCIVVFLFTLLGNQSDLINGFHTYSNSISTEKISVEFLGLFSISITSLMFHEVDYLCCYKDLGKTRIWLKDTLLLWCVCFIFVWGLWHCRKAIQHNKTKGLSVYFYFL